MTNNPARYSDPSGHGPCDEIDDNGNCVNQKISLKRDIESKYKVKVTGGWDTHELALLSESLNKTANYLGGADNLNQAIQASLNAKGVKSDYLTFYNLQGSGYCSGKSYNCYDSDTDTITISDGNFGQSYQSGKNRPSELGLNTTDMGAQVSIVHEMVHMLKTAIPATVGYYVQSVSNPRAIDPNNGPEENMANAIAFYVVSGGRKSYRYQEQLDFAKGAASLWNYSP